MLRIIATALLVAAAACGLFGPGEEDVVVDVRTVRGSWVSEPLAVLYHAETREEFAVQSLAEGWMDPDPGLVTLRATVRSEVCSALRVRIVPVSRLDFELGRCGDFHIQLDWTDTTGVIGRGRGL